MNQKRNLSLIAVLLAVSLNGCAAWKSGSVTHKVTASQHSFKDVVAGFQDAEIAAHQQRDPNGLPLVPDGIHLQIQQTIQKVALAGVDLDTFLATNPPSAGIKVKLDAIYTLLDSIQNDGLTGIKNPTTKASLEVALGAVKAIIDGALVQVQ